MINSLIKTISKKHLLVIGKSEKERHEFVDNVVETSSKQVYRFPTNIKNYYEYIDQVRTLFPFIPINWEEQNPNKWTYNQVWDFHLDWTDNTHSILIVIEEFGKMEEKWKVAILRDYLTTSYNQEAPNKSHLNFQLIVTQQEEDNLVEKLSAVFGLNENESRTAQQVILGKLEVINLDRI